MAQYKDSEDRLLEAETVGSGTDSPRVDLSDSTPDWAIRVVNPVLKPLLRSRFHGIASDNLILLTVTGQKSGEEYTFPVSYEQVDETLFVTSFRTNWWKNLRGGQPVTAYLRGERRTGHATVETDDEQIAGYAREYLERNGLDAAGWIGLTIHGDGIPDEDVLAAVLDRFVLIEIDLDRP